MENNLLAQVLFPQQYRRRVFAVLMSSPGRWVHLRELTRLVGAASSGSMKKELDLLVQAALLKTQKIGNQTQFSVNTDHPVFPELSGLVRKTIGLVDVLKVALEPVASELEVAFVFGSVARSEETTWSDVDVLLIGHLGFGRAVDALYAAQLELGREVNPKVLSRDEWENRKLAGNSFVRDLLGKPKLFIIGGENDL